MHHSSSSRIMPMIRSQHNPCLPHFPGKHQGIITGSKVFNAGGEDEVSQNALEMN